MQAGSPCPVGSFGEFDLDVVWHKYFETKKYERLIAARRKAVPDGMLTTNTFSVETGLRK